MSLAGAPAPSPAPAMREQLQAQLERVDAALRAADARRAPYMEVYRLVRRANALEASLAQLGGP